MKPFAPSTQEVSWIVERRKQKFSKQLLAFAFWAACSNQLPPSQIKQGSVPCALFGCLKHYLLGHVKCGSTDSLSHIYIYIHIHYWEPRQWEAAVSQLTIEGHTKKTIMLGGLLRGFAKQGCPSCSVALKPCLGMLKSQAPAINLRVFLGGCQGKLKGTTILACCFLDTNLMEDCVIARFTEAASL